MSGDVVALAEKWGNAVSEAVGKYGPEAAQIAAKVAWLDALQQVVYAMAGVLLGLATVVACYRITVRHIAACKAEYGDKFEFEDTHPGIVVTFPLVGMSGAILFLVNAATMLNPILWAGLADPRIWIVAKLLRL